MGGRVLDKKTIRLIFNYHKKYPKMSGDDLGRLVGISHSACYKIIKQQRDLELNPSLVSPTVSGISDSLFSLIREEMGLEPLKSENDLKTGTEKENEGVYLLKVLDKLDGINSSLMKLISMLN